MKVGVSYETTVPVFAPATKLQRGTKRSSSSVAIAEISSSVTISLVTAVCESTTVHNARITVPDGGGPSFTGSNRVPPKGVACAITQLCSSRLVRQYVRDRSGLVTALTRHRSHQVRAGSTCRAINHSSSSASGFLNSREKKRVWVRRCLIVVS